MARIRSGSAPILPEEPSLVRSEEDELEKSGDGSSLQLQQVEIVRFQEQKNVERDLDKGSLVREEDLGEEEERRRRTAARECSSGDGNAPIFPTGRMAGGVKFSKNFDVGFDVRLLFYQSDGPHLN